MWANRPSKYAEAYRYAGINYKPKVYSIGLAAGVLVDISAFGTSGLSLNHPVYLTLYPRIPVPKSVFACLFSVSLHVSRLLNIAPIPLVRVVNGLSLSLLELIQIGNVQNAASQTS